MEASKTTSDKKTAIKISEILEQILLKKFIEIHQEQLKNEPDERIRSRYSRMSTKMTVAIMREPKIEIILKRSKK